MMKKSIILISAVLLFLSVTTVSAGLFGLDIIESDQFSIECPEGFYKVDNTVDSCFASAVTGYHSGETSKSIKVVELNSSGFFTK